ncbi:hypothetical protein PK28_08955 [Hymenobacter sp. DG25B]|uniref:hypothetical protein n=1 Tax=Hymenobacter sp. DG25B TaxID=1385664 RepID=UPI0005411CDB|nr:hypothetical protein [Hymenobacter sp. DG25B]AIZ63786.1 hypothetical protein PK28_08955 [Hymenobacter sp. DG25B]
MLSDSTSPDFDEDELRRLWQATPEPAVRTHAAEVRHQLATRRRQILLQKTGSLAVILLVPPVMVWVYLMRPVGGLGLAGLLLAGVALLGAIWRKFQSLQLFYTFSAQDAPAAYVARLRRYYQWQQDYGLRFYQGYIILLNTGLALYFIDGYQGRPAWQIGLPVALAVFTGLVLRNYSKRYALQEQQETEQLLQGLQGFETEVAN